MTAAIDIEIASDAEPLTVRQALREATALLSSAGIESARLDAEVLLAGALDLDRSQLYLHGEQTLPARAQERLRSFILRRLNHEPVAYIVGRREFWSLDFLVTPAVLVPRPETELLVETVMEYLGQFRNSKFEIRILEIGTGSGAIAVSLAKEIGNAEIWAPDISPGALEVARTNARRHGVEEKIHFLLGDAFMPVRDRTEFFDVIVFNPPYVRRDELDTLPRDVREFEPRLALDGGPDGLDFFRRIIPEARRHLAAGGFLALEIGADRGQEVNLLFVDAGGYSPPRLYQDYAGKDRVVVARMLI
ncbi:MAG TPA: peptide chain release factor N(5)-glutamine methyltransferase [Candidatus Binatia bacterium]